MITFPVFSNTLKPRAEYIWLDADGKFRSKTCTLVNYGIGPTKIPKWTYDGSSTGQAEGKNSEVILVPVKICPDPFRKSEHPTHVLVWCDLIYPVVEQVSSSRTKAFDVCEKHRAKEPWFAFEQEYTLMNKSGRPLAFDYGVLPPQGPYYCGVGAGHAFGRNIAEEHYTACLYAGLDISGINAEVMPGQWEFQIGHAVGADVGDQLMIARYILERICEKHGVIPSLDPKPDAKWNGAGCHANFSTKEMREDGGYDHIRSAMTRLHFKHKEHIADYGDGNDRRLTGDCETAPIDVFTFGVADRTASVRIPLETSLQGKGYLEDRRPASNCDPYKVIWRLMSTIYGE